MTYRGHVQNGTVVLEQPIELAEGTLVRVEPVNATESEPLPTLAEVFKDVIGAAVDLPSDMAENHDRYLHSCQPTELENE